MGKPNNKRKLSRKRVVLWLGRTAVMGIARLASALPERSALKAGVRLGTLAHNTSARYRNVAIKNLTQVFGEEWDRARAGDSQPQHARPRITDRIRQ